MDEGHNSAIRCLLRKLGRDPTNQQVECISQIHDTLRNCEMSFSEQVGLGLMVQAWKEVEPNDAEAREMALIQVALFVCDGDLEIADNTVVVSKNGRRWLDEQTKKGFGRHN
jgi:hypothetical protein